MFDKDLLLFLCDKYDVKFSDTANEPIICEHDEKLVQHIKMNMPGFPKQGLYCYGEASFEANQVMQEPLEKLYKYENQPDWRKRMGWSYYIKTKETEINIEDIQKIVDKFPNDWLYFGESKRDEKPVKQDWGWSTIVDISNPWKNWDDEKLNQSVALLPIGGCYGSQQIGKTVCDFVVEQLKDLNYTILDVEFSY